MILLKSVLTLGFILTILNGCATNVTGVNSTEDENETPEMKSFANIFDQISVECKKRDFNKTYALDPSLAVKSECQKNNTGNSFC